MSVKISIIGAGSMIFSLNVIRDICLTENFRGSTVSLMDVDSDMLDAVCLFATRFVSETRADIVVEKTTDRKESLRDADFVINTACGLGHETWRRAWRTAIDHGYRMGGSLSIVSDEGFFINFYQYRLMEEIYRDMLEVCPEAWYLLVANPVIGGVTYLKRKYPEAKLVGICHGTHRVKDIVKCMGLDIGRVVYEVPGVNHFVWLTRFSYDGRDAFPLLEKWMDENIVTQRDYDIGPKAYDLYRRFGAWPIGDTATPGGNGWPYWYHTDDSLNAKWDEDPLAWFDRVYFRSNEERMARMLEVVRDPSRKVTEEFPAEPSGEEIAAIAESLAFNIPRVFIVNIPNDGDYVPGIPRDFQVEVPALINGSGVFGLKTHGLPKPLLAYALHDKVAPYEMDIAAYESGDADLLLSLIMMDPYTKSERQAKELLGAILDLSGLEDLRRHYAKRG
jgi:alpha-galactosidase